MQNSAWRLPTGTKTTDLSHWLACRHLGNYIHHQLLLLITDKATVFSSSSVTSANTATFFSSPYEQLVQSLSPLTPVVAPPLPSRGVHESSSSTIYTESHKFIGDHSMRLSGDSGPQTFGCLKPCPHCHRKRQLLQKSATVAVFGDSTPNSATVWTGFKSNGHRKWLKWQAVAGRGLVTRCCRRRGSGEQAGVSTSHQTTWPGSVVTREYLRSSRGVQGWQKMGPKFGTFRTLMVERKSI